jgi:hypothetical protein
VIQGLLNYYKFVDNRMSFSNIIHGLKHSCALTLALKFKVKSRAKIFKKYGSFLEDPESKLKIYVPSFFTRLQHKEKFLGKAELLTDLK